MSDSLPFAIRPMQTDEAVQVANLIFETTNHWYEKKGFGKIFQGNPEDCLVFTDVYEDLDPGCCLVAVDESSDRIIGSCFYHTRESHVSLGIMNATHDSGHRGIAKALLKTIVAIAKERRQPLRLVSSAFNLDSFSLYNKQGFAPYDFFQDMFFEVPESGVVVDGIEGLSARAATVDEVDAIHLLEKSIWGVSRRKDWQYFIENRRGIWGVDVVEDDQGQILGAIATVAHPGSRLLGPGIAKDQNVATLLIQTSLNRHKGKAPVFLIPSQQTELVANMYALGARNCELHVAQSLGPPPEINGIALPTFMPETG